MKKCIAVVLACGFFFAFVLNSQAKPPLDFSSPESLLNSYLGACQSLDFSLVDQCYTREYQQYIQSNKDYMAHRNTGQLRNAYSYWGNRDYNIEYHGSKAIIRFAPDGQRPEPLYLVKENGEWKIDGLFSIQNVKIQDSRTWFWKNPNRDNEAWWLDSR